MKVMKRLLKALGALTFSPLKCFATFNKVCFILKIDLVFA